MRSFLCLLCCFLILPLAAQELPKWRVNQVGLYLGGHNDSYAAMSMDYMRAYAFRTSLVDLDLQGMEEEVFADVSSGMVVLSLGMQPLDRVGNVYRTNQELRFTVELQAGKEAMIAWSEQGSSNTLVYCVIQNEASINGAYLLRMDKLPVIDLFVGAGASLSRSFGNQFVFINESNVRYAGEQAGNQGASYFRARGSAYYRLYLPFGLDLKLFENFRLSLETRIGAGVEHVRGDGGYSIPLSRATLLGMKYSM